MFKRFINWQPFFYPESDAGNPSGGREMSKEDIFEELNSDGGDDDLSDTDLEEDDSDEEPETPKPRKDKEDKKGKAKSEESDDEDSDDEDVDLADIEEDLKEPTSDDLELVTPVSRAKILKKYPELFKDFPYLEKAYYREQQFTEIFPHPSDARAALDKASVLDRFENDILNGDTSKVLKAVKSDTNAFNKLVDNYMDTLNNVDPQAHMHVVGNVIKQTIMSMVQNGRKSGNEALQAAAHVLNQYVFGSSDFEAPTKLSREEQQQQVDPEKERLKAERVQMIRGRFEDTRNDLNARVNNSIKSIIEQNIDPRNSMNDYVKRNAARDAMENVEKLIEGDRRFKNIVDRLWERAFREGFSKPSTDAIRSAYMSKAKTLLGSVIKKSRIDALRGTGRRTATKDTNSKPTRKGQSDNDERPRSSNRSGNSREIPKGMSTLEFLMQDDN